MTTALKFGFFLGCIMPFRYPGIEQATRIVCKKLGIELVELENISCCPAPGVTRSFDQFTWLVIGARNLAIAERKNVDIITVCNGCFGSLQDIAHKLNSDETLRAKVNNLLSKLGMSYEGKVHVRHLAEVFYRDVGIEKIKSLATTTKLPETLKSVAVHYGCHFLKPERIRAVDNPERPKLLDEIVTEGLGLNSVAHRTKLLCCGAGGGVRARVPQIALQMTREKLDDIRTSGANCIVDICPFCHLQFDRGQLELRGSGSSSSDSGYNLPVIHLSQLLALAFGVDKTQLGLEKQAIPVKL